MIIIEFTKQGSTLSEILLGICVNNNRSKVNKDCAYLIAQDLKRIEPTRLIHTYDKDELKQLLESIVHTYNGKIECKEIIPTSYDVGLIRTLKFSESNIESFLEQIFKQHRYYVLCEYEKNGESVKCVITHNPNVKEFTNINIRLSSSLLVNTSTLQFGKVDDLKRVMSIKNTIPESDGTYVIYVSQEVE